MSDHHTHPSPAVRDLIEAARVQGRREALAPVLALADEWEGWAKTRSTPRIDAFRDAAERLRAAVASDPDATRHDAQVEASRSVEDERWDTAVDWVLNHGVTYDLIGPFWAYCDGLITKKELRDESVSVETINRRRDRADALAPATPSHDGGERGGEGS